MPEWIEQWAILIPLLSAVVAWYANERSKRAWEEYVRKEQHYSALLRSLKGFYQASADKELREEFLLQLNLCWLYCPDEVIMKAYAFLDSVHEGSSSGARESEQTLGTFVSAIRQDMLSRRFVKRTDLDGSKFRRLASR